MGVDFADMLPPLRLKENVTILCQYNKINLGYQICLEDFGFVELIVVNLVLELVVNFVVQVQFAQVSFGQTQPEPAIGR